MLGTSAGAEGDLRAGRYVQALRKARGLSPEQMAPLCGVSAATIRNVESKGTIPHLQTQERIAAFLGVERPGIWKRERRTRTRYRSASERTLAALEAALGDLAALAALDHVTDPFGFGVAWAVIRAQNPYAPTQLVADRAAAAVEEWHGDRHPARPGA